MSIGDVIASIRRRKRIEQKDLADWLGISVSYLSLIENNRKKPSNKLLKAISEKLNVPLSMILFMVLEEKHFPDESKKEIFNLAKPVMEDLISLLTDFDVDEPNKKVAKRKKSHLKSSKKVKVS